LVAAPGAATDWTSAVKWYTAAAPTEPGACQNLGSIFLNGGHGVGQNLGEAVRWFTEGAERGQKAAMFSLAKR